MRYIVAVFLVNSFIFLCPVHASGLFHESGLSSLSMTTQYSAVGDGRGFLLGTTLSLAGVLDIDYGLLEAQYGSGSLATHSSVIGGTLYVLRNNVTQPLSLGFGVSYQPSLRYENVPILCFNGGQLIYTTGSVDVDLLAFGGILAYTVGPNSGSQILMVGTVDYIQQSVRSTGLSAFYNEGYWAGSGSLYFINSLTENLKGSVGATLSAVDDNPLGVGISGTLTYVF